MAKRPQTSGSRDDLYENYLAVSEWKEEPENNIVVVLLPHFTKKQISITCVRSPRLVQVTGEWQLLDNKRIRFNQAFPIPQNCKIDKISAQWHNGAVIITMPKETITQPADTRKEEAKPTLKAPEDRQQADSPKAAAEPKSSKDYQQVAPGKAAATSMNEKQTEAKKDAGSPNATSSIHREKKIEGKSGDSLIAQNSEKEVKQQKGDDKDESTFPESASTTMKQPDKSSQVPNAETIDQVTGKERGARTDNIVAESKMPENATEKTTQVKESSFPETSEEEKEKKDKSTGEEKQKEKEKKSIAGPAMKAVKGLSTEQNGDKQLPINIGVTALVLLVLGAYVSYCFGWKSKS